MYGSGGGGWLSRLADEVQGQEAYAVFSSSRQGLPLVELRMSGLWD